LPRRRFLKVGVLGTMLNLPQVLQAGSLSGAASGKRGGEKSCIFIVQQGGASHIDTLDLKPAAPAEYRGPYKPIATPVPGMQICELLPRLAKLAPHYCLIRSMTHAAAGHDDGMHVCLSGQSRPPMDAPYFGSIVSKVRPSRGQVPSYVWVQDMEYDSGNRYFTGGFLGSKHAPLRVGKGTDNFAAPGFRVTAFDPPTGMTAEQLVQRHKLLTSLDTTSPSAPGEKFRRSQERAFEMVTGPQARRAFDVDAEPARLRDRYGRHPLGQNLIVARRLIEAGVRLVSVHAFTGFEPNTKWPPVVNVWDMHGAEKRPDVSIFAKNTYGLPWVLPRFDEAVAALLEDLHLRGLLEHTLVVVVGEFGRTPRINANLGRDHYPACYSALVAGAGIRGGAIYGASDKVAAFPKDAPVTPEDFGATLLHALNIPPHTRLSPDGFTRPASTGRPILELFG